MTGLPPVLTVDDVLARYQLKDRRAARKVIDAAGGFHVAGRLVVREDRLDEWETVRMAARTAPPAAQEAPAAPRRPSRSTATTSAPLAPGWWRDVKEAG